MRSEFKLFLVIGILLLVFSGCGPLQQTTSRPTTPTATDTSTPLSAAEAPAPPIDSLHMIDAKYGWAWTSSNRLLRTTDGGQTWIDRTAEGRSGIEGSYLDAQTAWLPIFLQDSNRFGLLHTTDGGQTWTQYPYDGLQTAAGVATGLHFTDAMNGWAEEENVAAGNIFSTVSETQDGGATWTPIPIPPPLPESGLPTGTVHLCGLCDDSFYYDPGRMIIVNGDMLTMHTSGAVRMQVSFDVGKTWQTQNLPLPKTEAGALVALSQPVFFDGKKGLLPVHLVKMNSDGSYAYQHLAFYHTQDGGSSWSLLPDVLDHVAVPPPAQIVPPMQKTSSWYAATPCVPPMTARRPGSLWPPTWTSPRPTHDPL